MCVALDQWKEACQADRSGGREGRKHPVGGTGSRGKMAPRQKDILRRTEEGLGNDSYSGPRALSFGSYLEKCFQHSLLCIGFPFQ